MKNTLLGLFFLFVSFNLIAQDKEYSKHLIDRYYQETGNLKSSNSNTTNRFWLTPFLIEVKHNWNKLTPEAKTLFEKYYERPVFQGEEKIATYGNFIIHYSIDGPENENVNPADYNQSGIPDYVEEIAIILGDFLDSLYHKCLELELPPNDNNQINGAYYDIFLNSNMLGESMYGYVSTEIEIGDNPQSLTIENHSCTSHMVLRNNYEGIGYSEEISLKATLAHEYMHSIQLGYNNEMETWMKEAIATWAEEYAYPGNDDNFQYFSNVFSSTDVALNFENEEDSENVYLKDHWYGSWLFIKYMTEHTDSEIIRNIYEACINLKSIDAIDKVLINGWDSSFDNVFIKYVLTNSILSYGMQSQPFAYNRADDYFSRIGSEQLLKNEFEFTFNGEEIIFDSQLDGNNRLMRLSYDQFYLESNTNYIIEFSPYYSNADVALVLIKCKRDYDFEFQLPEIIGETQKIHVSDNTNWDFFIPVIIRLDKEQNSIESVNYSLVIKKEKLVNTLDFITNSNIFYYPNPAKDFIRLNWDEVNSDFLNLEIIDLTGKLVFSKKVNNHEKIDLNSLMDGFYMIQLKSNEGVVKEGKLIIRK